MSTRPVLIALVSLMHLAVLAQTMQDAPDLSPRVRLPSVSGVVPGDDGPRYGIRQDQAATGSNIRRNAVTGSIPFDKRYDELTPEQLKIFRSQYQRLGPRDEPPFPANGLATVYKAISVAQNHLQAQGTISLFVEVSSKGEPMAVSVFESPDPKMTRAVASILMLEKYKPALCDGTPCQMGFPVRLQLEVQ